MLPEGQAVANLVSVAHLAALAIENGCVLASGWCIMLEGSG